MDEYDPNFSRLIFDRGTSSATPEMRARSTTSPPPVPGPILEADSTHRKNPSPISFTLLISFTWEGRSLLSPLACVEIKYYFPLTEHYCVCTADRPEYSTPITGCGWLIDVPASPAPPTSTRFCLYPLPGHRCNDSHDLHTPHPGLTRLRSRLFSTTIDCASPLKNHGFHQPRCMNPPLE